MNCPFCNRSIEAFTGLMEANKFRKHLETCRKYPRNRLADGRYIGPRDVTLTQALDERAKSGQ